MIRLVKKAASAIANAAAGTKWFFIDNDGRLATKDEEGNVVEYTPLGTFDTDEVDEGATNLYYTEARVAANSAVSANTAKVSADGSVTTHNDVTDAGSGAIITTAERNKLNGIEEGATADQTGAEIKALYEGEADTNAFTDAEQAKVGHLTVTAATNLDSIRTRVDELDAAVVLVGSWDASGGTFPGGGTAKSGESWIVSVSGTVDDVEFTDGDRILALVDNASTSVYATNWLKLDYTDRVNTVHGRTGNVVGASGDYDASQVNNDSEVAGANVAAALDTLDSEKADASELGTAATRDTGPALTQVPTGQDLADGVARNSGIIPFYGREVTPLEALTAGEDAIMLIGPVNHSGGHATSFTMRHHTATEFASSRQHTFAQVTTFGRLNDDARAGVISGEALRSLYNTSLISCDYGGGKWMGVLFSDVSAASLTAAPLMLTASGFYVNNNNAIPANAFRLIPRSSATNEGAAVSGAGNISRHFGRPGDSIGDNGSYHRPSQSIGATNAVEYGTSTQSGDGSTVAFTIPHGLGGTPQSHSVTAGSEATAEKHWSTADATNITVTFAVAPASATDNLVFRWSAKRAIA